MWFWVAPQALESSKSFLWPRDSIYGAIVLLGAGGAITNVLSMVLVAYQIGPYSVSHFGFQADSFYFRPRKLLHTLFIFLAVEFLLPLSKHEN